MRKLILLLLLASFSAFAADQPKIDYHARRVALSQKTDGGVVLLFAASEQGQEESLFQFRQNDYFYYLTGLTQPDAALLIVPAIPAKSGQPERKYQETLYLPARDPSEERWTGPKLGPDTPDVSQIVGVDRVAVLDNLRAELTNVLTPPHSTVFTDLPARGATSPSTLPLQWLEQANAFPSYNRLLDVKPLIDGMRMIKDEGEMALIRYATQASVAAHLAAIKSMKVGLQELQVAWLMEYTFGEKGCERPAYAPIVGAGFNSTVLHYVAGHNVIRDGDVVVMDVAAECGMYASDITRTIPADGHFTQRQRDIYNVVLGAQLAAINAFQSGKYVIDPSADNSIYKVAYDYINTHGKDLHGQPLGKYFIHGLSHYVGLDVHDVGDTRAPLGPGMVFTIEPGIYIPEEKIGVRIEDLFWVDPDGKLVMLTEGLPRTPEEVEKAMKR
jgi:Xaa-Pro aminopeptidase